MRKIILATIMCLLLFTACGAKDALPGSDSDNGQINNQQEQDTNNSQEPDNNSRSEESEEKLEDYFPMAGNVHMVYRGEGNEYAEYETYVDYVKDGVMQVRNINPGTVSVKVYKLSEGELKEVFAHGEIYYRHDYTSSVNRDEILIKEPIKEGTSWLLADGSTRSITGVNKGIKTPAGDFEALEITTDMENSVIKDYYVKGIGLVKTVYNDKNGEYTVVSELEKIEKDVPFKQIIRFYYPDFLKDRIVYIDKEFQLETNKDILPLLEEQLKSVPENSELTRVLTPNVKIQGCQIDEEKNIMTVDFTSDLVNEMNAGAGLELMILKSITNTIGEYYQKDKVAITLDGKLYESGHILLKSGEYFRVDTEGITEYGEQ